MQFRTKQVKVWFIDASKGAYILGMVYLVNFRLHFYIGNCKKRFSKRMNSCSGDNAQKPTKYKRSVFAFFASFKKLNSRDFKVGPTLSTLNGL